MNLMFSKTRVSKNGLQRFGKILLITVARNYGNKKPAVILGIETSCDDTGCALVDSEGNILGEALHSQQLTHLKIAKDFFVAGPTGWVSRLLRNQKYGYGGIVPPVAQEMHRKNITEVCEKALKSADLRLRDVNAIAATVKPGLLLSLMIGANFGKYLSKVGKKPFIPIHHMEAHALTARMVEKVDVPFLVLLISGGHCLLAVVKDVANFYLLGKSIDDAPGEALDKAARRLKMRNIPEYSCMNGGAAIELAASRSTNPLQFTFPLQMAQYRDCNFSFSGLKNTMNRFITQQERDHNVTADAIIPDLNNLCAGFQLAIAKHLCHRTQRAMEFCFNTNLIPLDNPTLVVSGGVACNNFIAKALTVVCDEMNYKLIRPPPRLCTDNGIMIAWNGVERWVADEGVIRNPEEIDKVDIQRKAPLGEDWTQKVINENIPCKAPRTKQLL